jgi:hypothetical protein
MKKVTEIKSFKKVGGSLMIAVKNVLGGLDINTDDYYMVTHSKDTITIKKL